ncbi:hypothetical protein JZ751_009404 [Albula glossodonta]|uniref:Uncharacterized protein n=1 Tax=Albula glossodonta TaxID=121402 RepID=A0A8T2N0D6_9TELE|nr:hypothetical protein JZ751_009404 [Albula glossodonta]
MPAVCAHPVRYPKSPSNSPPIPSTVTTNTVTHANSLAFLDTGRNLCTLICVNTDRTLGFNPQREREREEET